jgi:DNA repair exonuclease SbcCD ATPase subunit
MGTQIEQLRFGDDLDFSVKFTGGQQVARGRALLQLSSGARDQLHLAVRLAISEYLSRGSANLPLLIDDAFASSDDERARVGMRLLLQHLSKRHQIVFVTCHRQRYLGFAEQEGELYAERVRWLDTRAAEVPR